MSQISILIVEDDLFIAEGIAADLTRAGYGVSGIAPNADQALESMKKQPPHLIIMDIELEGDMDGVELAAKVNKELSIPVVYLTSHQDERMVERAENIHHSYYVGKPYRAPVLLSNVKLALSGLSYNEPKVPYIFVKTSANSEQRAKVHFDDIVYLKAARTYSEIFIKRSDSDKLHCIVVSSSLINLLKELNSDRFIRTHRSYAVNIDFVEKFDKKDVVVDKDKSISLSDGYRKKFLERIKQA